MDRRGFVIGTLAMLGARTAHAQQTKVARIGYLSMAEPSTDRLWVAALREGLRELGYIEGQNLLFEQRHASQRPERVPELAGELVRRNVDVLVVYGSPAVAAVKKAGISIPVVMTVHADPVGSGVAASLARPGGNITGLTDGHADLAPKRLEMLKEVVPSASRVGAIFNPTSAHPVRQLKLIQAAAPKMGLSVIPLEIRGPDEIEQVFAAAVKQQVDSLFLVPDPTWWIGQEQRIANLAIRHRLPAIGTVRQFADNGILIAYGTNFTDLFRRSAHYVDRILKGAKPGDLPIEHPTKFHLVINMKTAKALGVSVPRAVVMRADEVLE